MKDKIGDAAGAIWKLLREKGEVNVSGLPRMMKRKGELVYQALGWLAREDKVEYTTRGAKTFVALPAHERELPVNLSQGS